jgi:tetratricopeptide (TPR) repeat protein
MKINILIRNLSIAFLLFCGMAFTLNAQERAGAYKKFMDEGRQLALQGKYQEAIGQFDKAIETMPYYYLLYQDRGYAEMQLKQYDAAIADFSVVLDKKPYIQESRYLRGIAYFNINELAKAQHDLEYLTQEPNPPKEVPVYLAKIRELQQKNEADKQAEHQQWAREQQILEQERIERSRRNEQIIWGTVVPLAFWTAVYLSW